MILFLLPNERYENGLSLFLTQTLAENTDFLA